jgi:hypothetical protein
MSLTSGVLEIHDENASPDREKMINKAIFRNLISLPALNCCARSLMLIIPFLAPGLLIFFR